MESPATRKRHPLLRRAAVALVLIAVAGGFLAFAKGRGWKTRLVETLFPGPADVFRTRPYDGEVGVLVNEFVAADVHLPHFGHGIDPESLSAETVKLYRTGDGKPGPANVNTSGAGDAIVLQPIEMLEPSTTYTFEVTPGVRDTKGTRFTLHKHSFTTSTIAASDGYPAAFEKVELEHDEAMYTGAAQGRPPALRVDVRRAHHPLGRARRRHARRRADDRDRAGGQQGPALVIGLRFDPRATADNLAALDHAWRARHGGCRTSPASCRGSRPEPRAVPGLRRRPALGVPRPPVEPARFRPRQCAYFVQGRTPAPARRTRSGAAATNAC